MASPNAVVMQAPLWAVRAGGSESRRRIEVVPETARPRAPVVAGVGAGVLGAVVLFTILAGTTASLAVVAFLSPFLLLAGVFCGVVAYVWVKDGPAAVRAIFKRRSPVDRDSPPPDAT
jgi:hypothetical protein